MAHRVEVGDMTSSSGPRGCLAPIDIFVLAGGLGTRIRPVLGDLPKVLAPISGRPYLAHLVDWLRRFDARRVVLGLGHNASAVVDYLRDSPFPGIDIQVAIEPEALGTAGALRFARPWLRTDPVLVMNGDTLTNANLCSLLERHREACAPATMLCVEVDHPARYGRVLLNERGHVVSLVEKDPSREVRATINAGVYLISAGLLDDIARGRAISLEKDVFQRLPAGSIAAMTGSFEFIDIGTPESLALASSNVGAFVAGS
jgi:NDP-sugar pyrophosphorylase family protein